LVGSSEAKKVPGLVRFFSRDFLIVFLTSPHREAPQNTTKQNREKIGLGFFCRFFCKNLSTRFFGKTFFVVLLNSRRKEAPEKAIIKKIKEKRHRNFCRFSENFLGKVFDMDFLHFFKTVFLNSPHRETPKNVIKKKPRKYFFGVGWFLESQAYIRRGPSLFFWSAS
jgi:hypothetical protein